MKYLLSGLFSKATSFILRVMFAYLGIPVVCSISSLNSFTEIELYIPLTSNFSPAKVKTLIYRGRDVVVATL